MALVGEAHIIVRAITNNVASDIQKGFGGSRSQNAANRAGQQLASSFSRGFNRNINANIFSQLSSALRATVPGADAARRAFQGLAKTSYTLAAAIPVVVGGISGLIGGLGAIAGSAGGAIASVAALSGAIFTLGAALATVKLATGGIGRAVSMLNNPTGGGGGGGSSGGGGGGGDVDPQIEADRKEAANRRVSDAEVALARVIERNRESLVDANNAVREAQEDLNRAFLEGREYIQQLGFDAEDAAIAEGEAALELEKARETLARVQDLPPNNRARKAAELAYQQAELEYRRAKDKSADLNKEQAKLARTGVRGTEAVIEATEDLAEAEKDKSRIVRDALRDQADAEQDLRDAIADRDKTYQKAAAAAAGGGGGGGGGGADPFAGLNDAQIKFAKFIASLKPKFDELSRIAAESFLPKLQEAIETLMGAPYDSVARGVGIVGSALGDASIELANMIAEAENIEDLNKAFDLAGDIIIDVGGIAANAWDIFMSLIVGSSDQLRRFVRFLEDKSGAFAKFLDAKQATGELQAFFKTSGDIMAEFGEIAGNVFGGIGAIIRANFSTDSSTGGGYLLNWLKEATQKFEDLDNSPAKAAKLKQYFLDVSENAQKTLSSIGALAEEIIKVGANPAIGRTFEILEGGAGFIGNLLEKGAEAGPVFAELVVELTEFLDLISDTGAIEIFFGTLRDILSVINDILKNEIVMQILTVIGHITALLLAFNTVFRVANFGFKILTGSALAFSDILAKLVGSGGGVAAIGASGTAAEKAGGKFASLKGSIGGALGMLGNPWVLAIGAAVAALGALQGIVDSMKASTEEWTAEIEASSVSTEKLFAFAEQDRLVKALDDATDSADKFRQKLDLIANNDFARGFDMSASELKADLIEIGENLALVAETSLPAASNAFKTLSTDMGLNKQEMSDLLDAMPAYKAAIDEQIAALGIEAGALSDTALKTAELKVATGEAITQSGDRILTLGTTTDAINTQKGALDNLATTIVSFGQEQIRANETNRSYQETADNVTASVQKQKDEYFAAHGTLDGFRASMADSTPEGRANQAMFEDLAKKTLDSAAANYTNTGRVWESTAAIEAGRSKLVEQMKQLGYTQAEAEAYADELGLIPKDVYTNLHLSGAALAYQEIMGVQAALREVTGDYSIHLATTGQGGLTKANGGFVEAGRGVTAAANGMIRQSQIRSGYKSGGGILWGEPVTGWEAYISGRTGQEDRNRRVLNEAASRLNMVPNTAGMSVQITINPPAGADNYEIAAMVSRELSFQLRKGGA